MSALDDLLDLLYGNRPVELGAPCSREDDATTIFAKHAHELAEKIRTNAHFYECSSLSWDGCEGCTRAEAADWVDPAVLCTCTAWQAVTGISDRHHDQCKANLTGLNDSEVTP